LASPSAASRGTSAHHAARSRVERDRYAILLKSGLTGRQRRAAVATLREKYNLRVTKANKAQDILYVSPRSPRADIATPPNTPGAALTPKIILDLRKEPFVEAAYVSSLATPKSVPRQSGRTGKKR